MKKVAVTVAVLALGLAACAKNEAAENDMTVNETYTENAAEADLNASMNAEDVAENALEDASNAIDNASDAVENVADNAAANVE
ncbi:circumsporozoite protein [Sphingomonas sabuli]|nr:circumsporozoite protein [Sphingomonas sabuli]